MKIKKIDILLYLILVIILIIMIKHRNINSYYTTNIALTSILEDITINYTVKGFLLKYKSQNYIITVHHGLPIDNLTNILINPMWNELLILNNNNENNLKEIKQIKHKISSINSKLYFYNNKNNRINIIVNDYTYFNINNLPINPRIIYIKASFLSTNFNLKSLSGSPVFNINDKLIGILCKQDMDYIYILPAYYIIKTLTNINNNSIYSIDFDEQIKYIDSSIVKDNYIYHKSLNINIPLDVYFVLNGDENNNIFINKKYNHRYIDINNDLPIKNERYIVKKNNIIIVNSTLLLLLKLVNEKSILLFIEFVKQNLENKIMFSINTIITNFKNKINKKIQYNNKKYNLTMYTIQD
jgi:hypothetical protein